MDRVSGGAGADRRAQQTVSGAQVSSSRPRSSARASPVSRGGLNASVDKGGMAVGITTLPELTALREV